MRGLATTLPIFLILRSTAAINNCTDSSTFTFGSYPYEGEQVERTCEWIAESPTAIDSRRAKWCDMNIVLTDGDTDNSAISDKNSVLVKEECPISCGVVCDGDEGESGLTFDLNQCSTYEELWQKELSDSCGGSNITKPTCACADAESKIASGQIDCPSATCPYECSVCNICIEFITDCMYATDSPSAQPSLLISDAPSSSPSIGCTSRLMPAEDVGSNDDDDDDTMLVAYGSTSTNGGSRDVLEVEYQYDLAISDTYPMVITDEDEGRQQETNSTSIIKKSTSMKLNETTLAIVLEEITQSLSAIAVGSFFVECMPNRRRLVDSNSTNDGIDIIGMTSTIGKVLTTISCSEDENQPNTTCIVIGSTTSLYFDDNNILASDMDKLKESVAVLIMVELSNLAGDLYTVKSVKSVEVVEKDDSVVAESPSSSPTSAPAPSADDNSNGMLIGLISAGAGVGVLLFGFVCCRNRRGRNGEKYEEEDLKNQLIVDDCHDGSFPVAGGSADDGNSKLGKESVDIDYSKGNGVGKDEKDTVVKFTDVEAAIEDDNDGNSKLGKESVDIDYSKGNGVLVGKDEKDTVVKFTDVEAAIEDDNDGNSKLGIQSVDIDYSKDSSVGKDEKDIMVKFTDVEAAIEDNDNEKNPMTVPIVEDQDSADKKLFSMDDFKNRLSVAQSMFTNGDGFKSDASTISSKDVRHHNLNPDAQYFSTDSFKHRMSITRNSIDSPARSARSKITNPISEVASENSNNGDEGTRGTLNSNDPLDGSVNSNDRINSARSLLLGTSNPRLTFDSPARSARSKLSLPVSEIISEHSATGDEGAQETSNSDDFVERPREDLKETESPEKQIVPDTKSSDDEVMHQNKEEETSQDLLRTNDTESKVSDDRTPDEDGESLSIEKNQDAKDKDEVSKLSSIVNDVEFDSTPVKSNQNVETMEEGEEE